MPNSSHTHHRYGKKKLAKMSKEEKTKFFMRQDRKKSKKSKLYNSLDNLIMDYGKSKGLK